MSNSLTPYIYDFDRGTIKDEVSPLPDFFSRYGSCHKFFINQDIGRIICGYNSLLKRRVYEGTMTQREQKKIMSTIEPFVGSKQILKRLHSDDDTSLKCWLGELCGPESDKIDAEGLLMYFLTKTCRNIAYWELTPSHPFIKGLLTQALELDVDVENIYKIMLENIVFVRKQPLAEVYKHVTKVIRAAIAAVEPNL